MKTKPLALLIPALFAANAARAAHWGAWADNTPLRPTQRIAQILESLNIPLGNLQAPGAGNGPAHRSPHETPNNALPPKTDVTMRDGARLISVTRGVNLDPATGAVTGPLLGGGGAASGSVSAPLGTYPAYMISYSAGAGSAGNDAIGVDTRSGAVTLNASGGLTGYNASASEAPAIGTAVTSEIGGNAYLAWGRWNGGALAGNYYAMTMPNFSATQGFHYIVGGLPTATMPTTGTASFSLLGATNPTGGGATGSFAGNMSVDFSAARVGVDFTVTMPDHTYSIVSTGGTATPASSQIQIGGGFPNGFGGGIPMPLAGAACTASNCSTQVTGYFVNTGADHAGVAYEIYTGSPNDTSVHGVAAFTSAPISSGGGDGGGGGGSDTIAGLAVHDSREPGLGIWLQGAAISELAAVTPASGNPTQLDTDYNVSLAAAGGTAYSQTGSDTGTGLQWGAMAGHVQSATGASAYSAARTSAALYAYGPIASGLPTTGTINYTLLGGAVRDTVTGASGGTLNSASLAVNFTNATADYALSATAGGATFTASRTGAAVGTYNSGAMTFGAPVTTGAWSNMPTATCSSGCSAGSTVTGNVIGRLTGTGGNGAIIAFSLTAANGTGTITQGVDGVAAFKKP